MPGPLGTGSGGGATGSVGTIGIPTTDGMIIGIKSAATGGLVGVQSAGTTVGNRATLNFSSGMTVTDNAGSARVDVAPSFGTPGAVTGGATAASGSATTLARSDHVHSTASMPVLLASTTLSSAAASYTFSSFSSAYKHLMILFMARSSATAGAYDTLAYQFNGDTAANYRSIANTTATSHASVAVIPNTTTFFPTQPGIGRTTIFYYNDTSSGWQKRTFTDTDSDIGTSATSPFTTVWGGTWTTVNTAITSVLIKTSNGNFVAGSRFDLYGIP